MTTTREQWIADFIAELRKGVRRGAETDAEHEAWLRQEAESHFDATAEAITLDPVDEASATLDAIAIIS